MKGWREEQSGRSSADPSDATLIGLLQLGSLPPLLSQRRRDLVIGPSALLADLAGSGRWRLLLASPGRASRDMPCLWVTEQLLSDVVCVLLPLRQGFCARYLKTSVIQL